MRRLACVASACLLVSGPSFAAATGGSARTTQEPDPLTAAVNQAVANLKKCGFLDAQKAGPALGPAVDLINKSQNIDQASVNAANIKQVLQQAGEQLLSAADQLRDLAKNSPERAKANLYMAYCYGLLSGYQDLARNAPVLAWQDTFPNRVERKREVNAWVGRGVQDSLAMAEISHRYLKSALAEKKDLPCSKDLAQLIELGKQSYQQSLAKLQQK
jgi:hypothetical protein